MPALYVANLAVLFVAAWALWERRLSFASQWDAPITVGIALFGVGAALDSPWPGVAAASAPLTGKFYLLNAFGHICYLLGAAMGIKATYKRLLPDDVLAPFMRTRVMSLVGAAAAVMLMCLTMSPLTSVMPADHLYLVHPDGWLSVYWVVFLGTLTALELISMYGGIRLASDPRSVMVKALVATQVLGILAIGFIGYSVLTGNTEIARMLVWPFAYAGIIGGSVAAVVSWRHRIAQLTRN